MQQITASDSLDSIRDLQPKEACEIAVDMTSAKMLL